MNTPLPALRLEGKPCEPTTSDFLIRIDLGSDEVVSYPDAMIIYRPTRGDKQFTTAPTVILEVLSPTARRIDETQKLRDSLTIPSLQACLLAETDPPALTISRRRSDSFRREILSALDATLDLLLTEFYQSVSFAESGLNFPGFLGVSKEGQLVDIRPPFHLRMVFEPCLKNHELIFTQTFFDQRSVGPALGFLSLGLRSARIFR